MEVDEDDDNILYRWNFNDNTIQVMGARNIPSVFKRGNGPADSIEATCDNFH